MCTPAPPIDEHIEYNFDADRFRVSFESPKTPPSVAIPVAVSTITGTEISALDQLGDVIDADALDTLMRNWGTDRRDISITFQYATFQFTVYSYGVIEFEPIRDELLVS